MTELAIVVAVLALELAAIALYLVRPKRSQAWLGRLEREPVLVTLKDRTFGGVLVDVTRDALALAQARLLIPGQAAVPFKGELVIPRAQVIGIQRGVTIDDVSSLERPEVVAA